MLAVAPDALWVAPLTIFLITCIICSDQAARMGRFLPRYSLYAAYAGHLWLLVLLAGLSI